MRPLKGKIIVKANLNQKEEITYGTLRLVIPYRKGYSEKGRVVNPTLCEVLASNETDIKAGDILIVQHNTLENDPWWIERDGDVVTLSIPVDKMILGKLGYKGELIPLKGNIVCKRITEPERSSIIITPDAFKKTEANKGIILAVAPDVKDLHEGQTAIYHTYSDYEVWYNINGEDRSAVVMYHQEIVAVA
jgi:co-chaperonin GroES (HSP10)